MENLLKILLFLVFVVVVTLVWHIIKMMDGDYKRENCERCGKPSTIDMSEHFSFCRSCRKEYDRLLEIEMKKQPKKLACNYCSGSGKIKGYKCVKCNGRGSIITDTFSIDSSARMTMEANSDFFAYRRK